MPVMTGADSAETHVPQPARRLGSSRPPRRYDMSTEAAFRQLARLSPGSRDHSRLRERIIERNIGLARQIAYRYAGGRRDFEDVQQAAYVGLIVAVDRFDVRLGYAFTTYAKPTIEGAIKRHFRDTTWAAYVPRRFRDLRGGIVQADLRFAAEHGRAPTTAEIAGLLGLTEPEAREAILAVQSYAATPIDPAGRGVADASPRDQELTLIEDLLSLRPLLAELPARDRRILHLRFIAEKTQQEIGTELGVSQMQVSRLLARILGGLRQKLLSDEPPSATA